MRLPVALTILVAALLAASRGLPFIVWPYSAFDADQAIVGLMAKHLAEARAFPLFYYGQPYMLAVQAWLAAPLFAVGGASITLLKLPLLGVNAAAGALLVWILIRDLGLRPVYALAASGLFLVATPVAGAQLVAAMGGSVEPFLYVLLIWLLRDRPVACGFLAGFGFLHREFSIYGLGALFVVDAIYRGRQWRAQLGKWIAIALAFLACVQIVRVVRPYNDMFGPDLPQLALPEGAPTFYAITTRLACVPPEEIAANVAWLFTDNLPTLLGTAARPENLFYAAAASAGRPWLLITFTLAGAAALLRIVMICWRARRAPPAFALFLLLIAVQSCVMYVASCDVRGPMLVRYTLLALLGPIGIAAAYFGTEPSVRARYVAAAALLAVMALHSAAYVALAREYMASPPMAAQAMVASLLESRGIRFARADYWDGYYITFVSNERIIVASHPRRIHVYESIVSRAPQVMYVQRTPCPDAEVVGRYWLCMDDNTPPVARSTMVFPPRRDLFALHDVLERKYQTTLGRAPVPSRFAVRDAVAFTSEYLRLRFSECDSTEAETLVMNQVAGRGVGMACGRLNAGIVVARDELLQFDERLQAALAEWHSGDGHATAVDAEGRVVWTQAYVMARLSGCRHEQAVGRVLAQIDGVPHQSDCGGP